MPDRWSERVSTRVLAVTVERRTAVAAALIVALLTVGYVSTYVFGGAHSVPPHFFYVPILFAGLRFGLVGAIPTAIASAILAGPLMPAEVALGTHQSFSDWAVRGAFFVAIGATLPAMMRRGTTTIQQERRNLRIEMEMRRALAHGEFMLFYQPIVDLNDGHIVGAEALLRWQHPERGLLLPEDFITDVERIGSIANWMLREAATTATRWRTTYRLDGFQISVNVSAQDLAQPDFVTQIRNALQAAQLDPKHLCLEVTESSVIDDIDSVAIRLQVLRSIGIKIAIDDFGTGHATLSYLQQLPIDVIKIDRSFVGDLGTRRNGGAIVASMLQLAHRVGAICVAEGVETETQSAALSRNGCPFAQGFLFSRPIPAAEFEQLLAEATAYATSVWIDTPTSASSINQPTMPRR
jgi:EAL domain-containing protein (putative c-di-GMP-specific phosphodiesterase class I)